MTAVETRVAAPSPSPSASAVVIPRLGGWWGVLAAPFCLLALLWILMETKALGAPKWSVHVWTAVVTWTFGRSTFKAKLKMQRGGIFSVQGSKPRRYKAGEKVQVNAEEPVTLRMYADKKSALQAWESTSTSPSAVAIRRLGGAGVLVGLLLFLALILINKVAHVVEAPTWTVSAFVGAITGWAFGVCTSKTRLEIQRDGFLSIQGARPRWYKAGEKVLVKAGKPITLRAYADEKSALKAWEAELAQA